MRSQLISLSRVFFFIVLTGLLLAVSACFRLVDAGPDSQVPSASPTPPTASGSTPGGQFKFLWMMDGATAGERFGTSVALLGDVDGDGTEDVAVGAIAANQNGRSNAGSVYVISLRTVRTVYRLDGQQANDQFGRTLAAIGDLDGDKVTDFVVGAPLGDVQSLPDAGYVMIYSGKEGKLLDYYTGIGQGFRLGHAVAGLGDLNGDGFPDFAVGTPFASQGGKDSAGVIMIEISQNHPLKRTAMVVYGEAAGDSFGASIASIGDINGDRVPDVAVGATGVRTSSGNTGRVYILSGRGGSVLYKIDGRQPGSRFGFSVAGIDDINADNLPDIVVGAPQLAGPDGGTGGKAYVFSGRDGSLIYELISSPPGSTFGHSVAAADFDGDVRADIIVSDPGSNGNHGSVHVFSGRDGKRYFVFTNNPIKKEEIGFALCSGKDLNGDGRAELIIGAHSAPNIEGKPTGRLYVLARQ